MTSIAWTTDTHFNCVNDEKIVDFAKSFEDGNAYPDAIVITGDVSDSVRIQKNLSTFLRSARKINQKCEVYFVLGNHDYYQSSYEDTKTSTQLFSESLPGLTYLSGAHDGVELSPETCLIGTDGWCDTRNGNIYGGRLVMSDWYEIRDLRMAQMTEGIEGVARVCKDLADAEVRNLWIKTQHAAAKYKNILIATHVPPWVESSWHEGAPSNEDYSPWFSCWGMGNFLEQFAELHPHIQFTVLCGHSHSAGIYSPLDNLVCYTGQAQYGAPSVAGRLLADDAGVRVEYFNNPWDSKLP